MILKADTEQTTSKYGIVDLRIHSANAQKGNTDYSSSKTVYFDIKDVKTAFSRQPAYMEESGVVIHFYDGSRIEAIMEDSTDFERDSNNLVKDIFRMKMEGTKWAEDHPEEYV